MKKSLCSLVAALLVAIAATAFAADNVQTSADGTATTSDAKGVNKTERVAPAATNKVAPAAAGKAAPIAATKAAPKSAAVKAATKSDLGAGKTVSIKGKTAYVGGGAVNQQVSCQSGTTPCNLCAVKPADGVCPPPGFYVACCTNHGTAVPVTISE